MKTTMKRIKTIWLITLIGILALFLMPGISSALDAPHNGTNDTSCFDCHLNDQITGVDYDAECNQCHVKDTEGNYSKNLAPMVSTHQFKNRGASSPWPNKPAGEPEIFCTDCHYFHFYTQHYRYGSQTFLVEGEISWVGADPYEYVDVDGQTKTQFTYTITGSQNNWDTRLGEWSTKTGLSERGLLLLPKKTDKSFGFEIDAVTDAGGNPPNTITVVGSINDFPQSIPNPSNYAIIYGQFIESRAPSHITDAPNIAFFDKTGDAASPNSFAYNSNCFDALPGDGVCDPCPNNDCSTADGPTGFTPCPDNDGDFWCDDCPDVGGDGLCDDKSYATGICQVCHLDTNMYAYLADGTKAGVDNTSTGGYDHANQNGADCTICHDHTNGFLFQALDCAGCHGEPPAVNYPDANGLVYNSTSGITATGSQTAGVHTSHTRTTSSKGCEACHGESFTSNTTMDNASTNQIHIGFLYDSSEPGQLNLSVTPEYNGQASVASTLGGANPYIGRYGESLAWTGTGGNDSLTCSFIYCHSAVQPDGGTGETTTFATPVWDNSASVAGCDACHAGTQTDTSVMNKGSHTLHLSSTPVWDASSLACSVCHFGAGADSTNLHADANINVTITSAYGGSYGGTTTPGDAYGSCTSVYCHSSGKSDYVSMAWGDPAVSGSLNCDDCHKKFDDTQADSYYTTGSANPRGWTISGMSVTHGKHLGNNYYGRSSRGANKISCATCHFRTTEDITSSATIADGTLHVDGTVQKDSASDYSNQAIIGGGTTCATVYCHSNGAGGGPIQNPVWANTATGACGDCHFALGTDSTFTSTHTAHVRSSDLYKYECDKCHFNIVSDTTDSEALPNILDYDLHVDANKDVVFDTADTIVGNADLYGEVAPQTCSNVYCHSVGDTSVQAGQLNYSFYANVTWGSTLGCDGCHGRDGLKDGMPDYDNTGASAGDANTNSHYTHVITKGYRCYVCHLDTVDSSTSVITASGVVHHVDGNNQPSNHDVAFYEPIAGTGATYNPAVGQKTCDSLSCHDNTLQWGGEANCDTCHGAATGSATKVLEGAHPAHFNTSVVPPKTDPYVSSDNVSANKNNYSTASAYIYRCATCHHVTIAGYTDEHKDYSTEPGGDGDGYKIDLRFDVNWATGFTGGSYNSVGTIQRPAYDTGNTGDFDYRDAGVCTSVYCHSDGKPLGASTPDYKSVAWNVTVGCSSCHGSTAGDLTTNVHEEHLGSTMTIQFSDTNGSCVECHDAVATNDTIKDKSLHVNFAKNVDWSAVGVSQSSPAYDLTNSSCNSNYCHGNGTLFSANRTPVWDDTTIPQSMRDECTLCHSGNANASGGYIINSQNHQEHMNNASLIGTDYPCGRCHAGTVATSSDRNVTNADNHVDGTAQVVFSDSGAWDGTDQCSNTYCHSTGRNNADVDPNQLPVEYGSPRSHFTTVTWGDGTDLGCNACHGKSNTIGAPDYSQAVQKSPGSSDANNHAVHAIAVADCSKCHFDTTLTGTSIASSSALHINDDRATLVSFNDLYDDDGVGGDGNRYNNYAESTKTCSNITCHGGDPSSIQWGDTIGCGVCHAVNNTLAYGHNMHYETATNAPDLASVIDSDTNNYVYRCGVCHYNINHGTGTWPSANQTAEVRFDETYTGTGSANTHSPGAGPYNDGGFRYTDATCSTYCHSKGTGTGTIGDAYTTVTWADSVGQTVDCNGCHGTTSANLTSFAHPEHINAAVMSNADCDDCHYKTTNVGSTQVTNKKVHVDTVKDLEFAPAWNDTSVWSDTAKTCSNVYCHSSGTSSATARSYHAIAWTDDPRTCTGCHADRTTDGSAGDPLSVNHSAHLNQANYGCATCHSTVVSNDTTVSDPSKHVDKQWQLAIAGTFGGDGEGVNWSGTSCSATLCHGERTGARSLQWGTSLGSYNQCTKCHGTLTASSSQEFFAPPADLEGDTDIGSDTGQVSSDIVIGAHQTHLSFYNNMTSNTAETYCLECHNATMADYSDSNPMYTETSNHFNDVVTMSWGPLATYGGLSPTWSTTTQTCDMVYCHGNGMPSGTNTGNDRAPEWNQAAYLSGTSGQYCSQCHDYVPAPLAVAGQIDSHIGQDAGACAGCHTHLNSNATGFVNPSLHINGGPADVEGGSCSSISCHAPLYNRMVEGTTSVTINPTTSKSMVYKHFLIEDFEENTYPILTQTEQLGDASSTNRSCLICHINYGGGFHSGDPSLNLRKTISYDPNDTTTNPALAGGIATDYIWDSDGDGVLDTDASGGICLSCHNRRQTKAYTTDNDMAYVPPIPYSDDDDETRAPDGTGTESRNYVSVVKNSTHNYAVMSGTFKNSSARFQAVCSKCHNDTLDLDPTPDNGRQKSSKDAQTREPRFGLHSASRNTFLAVMGSDAFKDFNQGQVQTVTTAAGYEWIYTDLDITKDYAKFAIVITKSDGTQAQRIIIQTTDEAIDAVGVDSFPLFTPTQGADLWEITKNVTPIEEVCFNCHSQGQNSTGSNGDLANGYKPLDQVDFYAGVNIEARGGTNDTYFQAGDGDKMQNRLEMMYNVFIGETGKVKGKNGQNMDVCMNTYYSDGANAGCNGDEWFAGWNLQIDSLRYGIECHTETIPDPQVTPGDGTCGDLGFNYVTTMTLEVRAPNVAGGSPYKIYKPSLHPLNHVGNHRPDEMLRAPTTVIGNVAGQPEADGQPFAVGNNVWNVGDSGVCLGNPASPGAADYCTDTEKAWSAINEFGGNLSILFTTGECRFLSIPITSITGGDTVNFTSPTYPGTGLPCRVQDVDAYVIGNRHVACTDCHNTHAAQVNPTGDVGEIHWVGGGTTTETAFVDCSKTETKTAWNNTTDGGNGEWSNALTLVNDLVNNKRYVRQITQSCTADDLSAAPCNNGAAASICQGDVGHSGGTVFTFGIELDATPFGSSFRYDTMRFNGETGSGGKGVWGVEVSGYQTPTSTAPDGANLQDPESATQPLTYVKKYDAGRYYGLQYEQCLRCHSYYGFKKSNPGAPSGFADGSPTLQTDVSTEINPNNLAHHAVFAVGKNQPILPTGLADRTDLDGLNNPNENVDVANVTGTQTFSAGWSVIDITGTVDGTTNLGLVDISPNTLPDTALPGWYVQLADWRGTGNDNNAWYQITRIESTTQFYIKRTVVGTTPATETNPMDGNPWNPDAPVYGDGDYPDTGPGQIVITAGLGETFVPPFGPWSIIRCTDCHGSTLKDPTGPHASTNKWLQRDAELDLQFDWWDQSLPGYSTIDYGTVLDTTNPDNANLIGYTCYNCHRADVYPSPADAVVTTTPVGNRDLARIVHGRSTTGGTAMWDGCNTSSGAGTEAGNNWPQYCRNCHSGDMIGSFHGSNDYNNTGAPSGGSNLTNQQGKRFLNGASWAAPASDTMGGDGLERSSTGTPGNCYTSKSKTAVNNCAQGHGGIQYGTTATYDYDNP